MKVSKVMEWYPQIMQSLESFDHDDSYWNNHGDDCGIPQLRGTPVVWGGLAERGVANSRLPRHPAGSFYSQKSVVVKPQESTISPYFTRFHQDCWW